MKPSSKQSDRQEKPPVAFQIARQLDQERIHFLTLRIEELLRSNNELRSGASQNEKDTHDIVLYFQREMEIKDDIILRLNEELVKCQTQLKFEVEKVRKAFEAEITELRYQSEQTITNLTTKVTSLETELKAVEVFRREKDLHEEQIAKLERMMQQQREQLIDAMEGQERRFLEEKSQIFRELDEQKAAFREVALNEARSAMGEEVKKILADNNRMFEELKLHQKESADFQTEKVAISPLLCRCFSYTFLSGSFPLHRKISWCSWRPLKEILTYWRKRSWSMRSRRTTAQKKSRFCVTGNYLLKSLIFSICTSNAFLSYTEWSIWKSSRH